MVDMATGCYGQQDSVTTDCHGDQVSIAIPNIFALLLICDFLIKEQFCLGIYPE